MKNSVPMTTMVWFAGLSMLGFLATDMYLPAFENIRLEMGTTQSMIGLSLTVFLLGMALGQVVYGPLSDRIGRIKVLVGGMALFTVATVACFLSDSIEVFLAARFVQALGACSASVIWQAIVIDRYDSKTSQRVFATVMPLVALSPALAPLAGAALESHFGWRSIFIALVGLGVLLVVTTLRQEESAPAVDTNEKMGAKLVSDYKHIVSSRKFVGNMLIFAGCSAAFFAWLTGSPFVMTEMGYSGADIGMSYVPQTIAFIVGGYSCRALLNKYDGSVLLPWYVGLFIASVSAIFVVSWQSDVTTIMPVLIPFCFLAVANGAIYPIVVNKALEDFKHCSATAAGLLNFLQTMICFVASGIVSALAVSGLLTVSAVMMGAAASVALGLALSWNGNRATLEEGPQAA
ncbi:Bcr/CflA family multidrug efflux transporter [Enterovibrio norvegicus]|uniref:purine nucleoside transporter PunC n=1 Tax=Enterovibrio norvegicus TaxID=188144 RepID=UPI000C84A5E5|nr:purine nucleoside transporter PunC [Enterovibrio norvegicus]MCC4797234.1 Bcr/CflA family multidrug efflux MFS transporter [Enterovibrio norvegicus]PMI26963.1 Bcr/CflA family multidrug efflux transporter [Enterovibrio norvegicus]PMI40082.1 Bcr/CflA family multidrug efflux transporter [Enterovibrio norvegicus]PMN56159.1 Bcr/CflA family multidrug efflux transporter [Enterovibrio norvegicus]TKF08681.1 Bcr/CflA family multidrug efflux MFS transporter [Enterovibrio norvegicus]